MAGTCRCSGDGRKPRSSHRRRRAVAEKEHSDNDVSTSDSEVEASPYVSRYAGSGGCAESGSVRQVDAVCGTHTYTVIGYTLARAMGPGTRLCSELFEVGGQLFRLEVYPAGLDAHSRKYVSLFLTTPGTTRPGHLLYELCILDKAGSRPQHITESRTAHPPAASPSAAAAVQAPHPGVVAGFPRFIKANFLHRNAHRFLPDDTLAIRATVRVLTGRSSSPVAPPAQPQLFCLQPDPIAQLRAQQAPQLSLPLPPGGAALPLYAYGAPAVGADALASPSQCLRTGSCRCGCGYGDGRGGSYCANLRAVGPLWQAQQQPQVLLPYPLQQQQQQQQLLGGVSAVPFPAPATAPSMLPYPSHLSYSSAMHPLVLSG